MKKTKIKKDLSNKIKEIGSGNKVRGITLISLVITIIILIILAGVTLNMLLGENGIINRTKTASEEYNKQTATETMNLKITNVQISTYTEKQRMPTLKELADNFCEDGDFEKVIEKTEVGAVGNLPKISNENPTAIITKLKAYPYEFEINSSLQLASIDGVKVASNDTNEYVSQAQYNSLLARVVALENNSNSQSSSSSTSNNYSTDEQVVGTWIDGKPLYQKTISPNIQLPNKTSVSFSTGLSANIIDTLVSMDSICRCGDTTGYWRNMPKIQDNNTNIIVTYQLESNNTAITAFCRNGDCSEFYLKHVTLKYTKTTDTASN